MTTYTTNLRLTLPVTGTSAGTWGDTVNTGITALSDAAIAGTASVTMTGADKTLSANNGTADEARQMFINLTGTPGASYNVIVPTSSKLYFVKNGTGYAQTVKTAAGTGISVPNGAIMALYCNATNVVDALSYMSALTLGAPLPVASGGTGLAVVGAAGNVLTSDGFVWASSAPSAARITRSARTSNTILGAADRGTWVDITSGTFSQTFTAAATLAAGWWCYLSNSGTGIITLDPDGAEGIDGLTSYLMYPGEMRLVQCSGAAFTTAVVRPFYLAATASGTFTTPPGYKAISIQAMGAGSGGGGGGGGGSGRADNATDPGGGGGAGGAGGTSGQIARKTLAASLLAASVSYVVGAGGAGGTVGGGGAASVASTGTDGTAGGAGSSGAASTFGSATDVYYVSAAGGTGTGVSGGNPGNRGQSRFGGNATANSATLLTISGTVTGSASYPTAAGGTSVAGSNSVNSNLSDGAAAGAGGTSSVSPISATTAVTAGGAGGLAQSGAGAGNAGSTPAKASAGQGGAGGGGGSGSKGVASGGTSAAGGAGAIGGEGGDGRVDIWGVA